MKRPLAVIGFSFSAALLVASFFSIPIVLGAAFACSLFSFFLKKDPTKTIQTACLCFILGLVFFCVYQSAVYQPLLLLDGKTLELKGTVVSLGSGSGSKRLMIRVDKIGGATPLKQFSVLVTDYGEDRAELYDSVSAVVKLNLPETGYGFDPLSYYKSKDIFFSGTVKELYVTGQGSQFSVEYQLMKLRQGLTEAIAELLPGEQGNLLIAMLFGEQTRLSDPARISFEKTGVTHILSVSGLHVTIIAEFLLALFLTLRLSKRWAYLLGCGVIWIVIFLTGFSMPAVRAGIMATVSLIGFVLNREADGLNSLGLALLLILIPNPFAVSDISLLLSFAAMLGIIVMTPKLTKKLSGMKDSLHPLISTSLLLSAQTAGAVLFTLPVMIYTFGRVSLLSPFANLLIVPLCPLFLISGIVAGLAQMTGFLSPVALSAGFVSGNIGSLILWISDRLTSFYQFLQVNGDFMKILMAAALILAAFGVLIRDKEKLIIKKVTLCIGLLFFTSLSAFRIIGYDDRETAVFSLDSGIAVVCSTGSNSVVIAGDLDYSAALGIESYLEAKGIKEIGALAITNGSAVLNRGALRLNRTFAVGQILACNSDYYTASPSDKVTKFDEAELELSDSFHIRISSSGQANIVTIEDNNRNYRAVLSGSVSSLGTDVLITEDKGKSMATLGSRCILAYGSGKNEVEQEENGDTIVHMIPGSIVSVRSNQDQIKIEDVWYGAHQP